MSEEHQNPQQTDQQNNNDFKGMTNDWLRNNQGSNQGPKKPEQKREKAKMGAGKLALIIFGFIAFFGIQIAVCASITNATINTINKAISGYGVTNGNTYGNYGYDLDDLFSFLEDEDSSSTSSSADTTASNNSSFRTYWSLSSNSSDSSSSTAAITQSELDQIKSKHFSNQGKSDKTYSAGVYVVGQDIDAGTYRIYGDEKKLSYFFVLNKAENSNDFDTAIVDTYYGNNLINLTDGQVIIVDNEKGFLLSQDDSTTYSNPYKSGVYEVGKDIPAGTYSISEGSADDYIAYFIMKDLNYTDESVTDYKAAYSAGSGASVTLEEGTYVELYNIVLSKGGTTGSAFA